MRTGRCDVFRYLLTFLIQFALFIHCFIPSALSQQEEAAWYYQLYEDIPLVFLTTKRVEKTSESSLNIRVITREDIERWGFQTLQDIFYFLENSFVTHKGRDRILGVRGITGYANDKIKFLIDGFELPFMLGLGEGEFPVTLDEVKRIEIIKGPNTSIFGGNATVATVNVIRMNGADLQGTRTGVRYDFGERKARGAWVHHGAAPTNELNYSVYFNTYYSDGWDMESVSWGGPPETTRNYDAHNRSLPLPDHELIASVNYADFRMMYRRVEGGRTNKSDLTHNRNYTDALGVERTFREFMGRSALDLVVSVEVSAFGQEYDIYHQTNGFAQALAQGGQEHKAEKRLEWDAHIRYTSQADWDLLAGVSGHYWRAESTPWGGYPTESGQFPPFNYAPEIASGFVSDEFFPSFTEVNDLANWEFWADWKWSPVDNVNVVLGGRYVHDFEPDNQLRTDDNPFDLYRTRREHLRDFFPKAAIVWLPREKLALKLIYQEGYNRPNTNEQFSMLKAIGDRGRLQATTAKTIEAVLDWRVSDHLKTQVAIFQTKIDDFVNFVYTGPGPFPVIEPGDTIGFVNVGDVEVQGFESTLEWQHDRYGALWNFGILSRNRIKPFPQFDPRIGAKTGGTGSTGIIDTSRHNKQTYPDWTSAAGVWVKPHENVTLSLLWKYFHGLKNNEVGDNFGLPLGSLVIDEVDLDVLDLTLNWKNILDVQNLNFQMSIQNMLNTDKHLGSALDPAHYEEFPPRFIWTKLSYLFGGAR